MRNSLFGTVGSDKSPTIWSIGVVPVYEGPLCSPLWAFYSTYELVGFTDTLAAASPALSSPADQSVVPLNKATGLAESVAFIWSKLSLSSDYEIQVALDSNFNQVVQDLSVAPTSLSQDPVSFVNNPNSQNFIVFNPDQQYFWRVRSDQINVVGGVSMPFYSQWTSARSFKVGSQSPLTITAPAVGATDVSVMPTFSWTPVQGATTYEIVVSEDPTFAIIDFSRTSDKPEFASDEALPYNTVIYWRVRASAPASAVTPQVNGIFTTMTKPTTQAPPITITTQPPATITVSVPPQTEDIPSYLLWIIIAIGAILVIALIVLIVRTRARGG